MADMFCSDCKMSTKMVFDHSAGDTVCSECGLVLEAHSIDETSEWRMFTNESEDNDPVHIDGPTNPLLTDDGLSTVISKPNDVPSLSHADEGRRWGGWDHSSLSETWDVVEEGPQPWLEMMEGF